LPVGAHHDPGDVRITRQPPGPGGGDHRTETQATSTPPGARVDEVFQVDAQHDLRLPRPQLRQFPERQLVVTQLHEGIGVLLPPAPVITLRAVGLHDRLDRGLYFFEAHGVQVEPAGAPAVGVPGHGQPPTLGRIRLHPVGIQRVIEGLHRHRQHLMRRLSGHSSPGLVERSQVDPLLSRGRTLGRPDLLRDHVHLCGGDRPLGEPRCQRREVLQSPPRPHDPHRLRRRKPGVPDQPRPHRLQPVVLRSLGALGVPHTAGQLRRDLVLHRHQQRDPLELRTGRETAQVLGGDGAQQRPQLAHSTPPTPLEHLYEEYRSGALSATRIPRSATCPQIAAGS
jgi:hypothetical protein